MCGSQVRHPVISSPHSSILHSPVQWWCLCTGRRCTSGGQHRIEYPPRSVRSTTASVPLRARRGTAAEMVQIMPSLPHHQFTSRFTLAHFCCSFRAPFLFTLRPSISTPRVLFLLLFRYRTPLSSFSSFSTMHSTLSLLVTLFVLLLSVAAQAPSPSASGSSSCSVICGYTDLIGTELDYSSVSGGNTECTYVLSPLPLLAVAEGLTCRYTSGGSCTYGSVSPYAFLS